MGILEYNELKKANQSINSNRMAYPISEPKMLTIPTYDGTGQAVHPSVVVVPRKINGYKYWMAMTPYTGSSSEVENPSILASNDGVEWVVPAGITNPIEPSPDGAAYNRDAEIVYDAANNSLRIYWGNSLGEGFYRELNSSGVLAEKVKLTPTFTPFGTSQASIVKVSENEWVAFCQTIGKSSGIPYSLSRLTSTDGIDWKGANEVKTNLINPVWHVGVTYTPEGYHFLACAYTLGGHTDSKVLYYGFSSDGENVVFDLTPIIAPNFSGWMDTTIYKSHLIPWDNGIYRLYFSAYNKTNNQWNMGYVDIKTNNPALVCNQYYGGLLPRTTALFNQLEIRDTARYYYKDTTSMPKAITDFALYPDKVLLVYSTLNQPVKLAFRTDFGEWWGIIKSLDAEPTAVAVATIPAKSGQLLIDKSKVSVLGLLLPASVTVSVQYVGETPPTEGSISIAMKSWK